MATVRSLFEALPPDRRRRLTDIAREVSLPRATRLLDLYGPQGSGLDP